MVSNYETYNPGTPSPSSTPTSSPNHLASPPFEYKQQVIETWNTYVSDLAPPAAGISDLNPNNIMFMRETAHFEDVKVTPAEVLRQIICNPLVVPGEWNELKMLNNKGDLIPAHLPNISDLVFLSPPVKQLFFWLMGKMSEERSINVIPPEFANILDPPPVIPPVIEMVNLRYVEVNVHTVSWTNAMKLLRARRPENQIQLTVSWEPSGSPEKERPIHICCVPRHYVLIDPCTGLEREYVTGFTEEQVEPFHHHQTIPDLLILYWNARGMARRSILRNIRDLIIQHQPHMIVITEHRLCRSDTSEVLRMISYDKWMMVDPTGFSGGIVVIWRQEFLDFVPINTTLSSIHGVIQGPNA